MEGSPAKMQGVVQGRGGLVLGPLIPCALFYFLQLYIKRNRPPQPLPRPGSPPAASAISTTASPIHRSHSRGLLSPRAALPALSARGAVVPAGDENSLYYAGIRRCAADLYHLALNPDGVINLGLAENHLSLDLVGRWIEEHAGAGMLGAEERASPSGGSPPSHLTTGYLP